MAKLNTIYDPSRPNKTPKKPPSDAASENHIHDYQ